MFSASFNQAIAWVAVALLIAVSADAAPTAEPTRERLIAALIHDHVFEAGRQILRVAHLCDLRFEGIHDPVVDLVEQVPGAQVPRGVRRILVLTPTLKVVRQIKYDPPAEPLFCANDTLYFSAPIRVENLDPQGNAISFTAGGETTVTQVDPNHFPAPTAATILQQ